MGEKGMEPTGSVAGVADPQGLADAPPPMTDEQAAGLAEVDKMLEKLGLSPLSPPKK